MRVCSKCGAEIGDNNAFCIKCGTPVGAVDNNANQQFNAGPNEGQQQNNNQQFNAGLQQNNQQFNAGSQQNNQQFNAGPQVNYQQQYVMRPNYDHTAEFDAKDVSDNKVLAIFAYLDVTFGILGVIVALLGSANSKFTAFHARQSLKIAVVQILFTICWGVLFGIATGIAVGIGAKALATMVAVFSFLYGAGFLVLFIVRIVSFFQACTGKSIEPIIIRAFGFLR